MSKLPKESLFKQVISRLPSTVMFNTSQLDALKTAFGELNWHRHFVDIRLSLFGGYVVLLAGRERRSQKRLQMERRDYPLWTAANILMFLFIWGVLLLALVGLIHLIAIYSVHWTQFMTFY